MLLGHTDGDDPFADAPAEAFDEEEWWGNAGLMTLGNAALTRQLDHLAVEHERSNDGKLLGVTFRPTAARTTQTVAYTVAAEVVCQVRPACVVRRALAQAARQRVATAVQMLSRWLCVSALPTNVHGHRALRYAAYRLVAVEVCSIAPGGVRAAIDQDIVSHARPGCVPKPASALFW